MVLGFVCFIIGVSQPVITDFFVTADAALQLQYIEANPSQWLIGNLFMGIGAIIAASGVIVFIIALQQADSDNPFKMPGIAAAIFVSLASASWMFICYNRFALPATDVAGNQNINSWAFPVFSILITLGILLTGFIIMRVVSKLGGIFVMALEFGLMAIALIVFRDPIPALHFLPILIMGITLIAARNHEVPGVSQLPAK